MAQRSILANWNNGMLGPKSPAFLNAVSVEVLHRSGFAMLYALCFLYEDGWIR